MCRPEPICELVYCSFNDCTYIIDISEFFAVAALYWREEIKHVGVYQDALEPARVTCCGNISAEELLLQLLCFTSVRL